MPPVLSRTVSTEFKYIVPGPGIDPTIIMSSNSLASALNHEAFAACNNSAHRNKSDVGAANKNKIMTSGFQQQEL